MNDISPRMAARGRLRSMLVVSQVAVSLVLLVAAGLVLRSYAAAQHADGGFDAANVTSDRDRSADRPATTSTRGRVVITRLLDALAAEPAFEQRRAWR